jgi:aldehyde dehydrogenase (NAD+)
VWSENINLALDIAPKLKAGTVWINCTNSSTPRPASAAIARAASAAKADAKGCGSTSAECLARREVDCGDRPGLHECAAWADKWDGAVHRTPFRNVTLAMPEPLGVLGIICPDESPLLAFLSLVAPAIASATPWSRCRRSACPLPAQPTCIRCSTRPTCPPGVVNISPAAARAHEHARRARRRRRCLVLRCR